MNKPLATDNPASDRVFMGIESMLGKKRTAKARSFVIARYCPDNLWHSHFNSH